MNPVLHDGEDWRRALASDVHELQVAQRVMQTNLRNLNATVEKLAMQREKDHEANINVQLEIARGQGSIKTLIVIGGGFVGLLEAIHFVFFLFKH